MPFFIKIKQMGKTTFLKIISIVFLIMFVFLEVPILTKSSFLVNLLVLLGFTYYNIKIEKEFSPFLSVFIVFNLLFFIVAPLIQINEIVSIGFKGTGSFIQAFPFYENICIRANLYILIFNCIFAFFYLYFKKIIATKTTIQKEYKNTPIVLLFLFLFCVIVFLINIQTVIFQFQHEYYEEAEQTSVSKYLIVQKFLFFIPLAGIILSYFYLKSKDWSYKNYKFVLFLFVGFLVILLILKNPLTEKRNALGPLYITLLFLFFRKYLSDNYKVLRFMFVSMVFFFPLMSIITHSRYSLSQMIAKPILLYKNIEYLSVADAFNSLHYDAYPNFLATIDYFDNKTIVYGEQLLCSLFFFVPRSIWESKPDTTGFVVGNYLIDKYKFNWDNLSNPYISEGYINFGFIGILLFAVILSFVFVKMIKWLQSGDILKSIFAFYFAIYLMYFLRGDLTSGFAYIMAFLIAVVYLPKIFFLFINYYGKK